MGVNALVNGTPVTLGFEVAKVHADPASILKNDGYSSAAQSDRQSKRDAGRFITWKRASA